MLSGAHVYGPYYRLRNTTTQSDMVAMLQQQSQEIWGRAAQWSSFRSVKAYVGSLPASSQGIEFMTAVMPSRACPHNVFWYEGDPGVSVNTQGYAVIRVIVTKKVP